MNLPLTRRGFVVAAAAVGGGLLVGIPGRAQAADAPGAEFSPWLTIDRDGNVTVMITTPEIGNGVGNQAALLVAEELGSDWRRMAVAYASPAREARDKIGYGAAGGNVAWFGGRSMLPDRMKLLLQIGASARERLKAAAALRWKVSAAEITVDNGELIHAASRRRLGFGAVASDAAAIKLAEEPALKPESEWKLIGKVAPTRLGLTDIVNGRTLYSIDVRRPAMAYAALRQSPVQGGRLRSFDAAAVRRMPGVLAVVAVEPGARPPVAGKEPMGGIPFSSTAQSAVAVVAEHYWQARKALDALPVEWDPGEGAKWKDTAAIYDAAEAMLDEPAGKVALTRGDVAATPAAKTVTAAYRTPYCEHAPLEPLNATALCTADSVEVWHGGQQSAQGLWVAADEAGLPLERAIYHQTAVGGAFGRRIFGDDARMAVAVARQLPGRPIHLIWSREEMMRQGRYRPLVAARVTAKLGDDGKPAALTCDVAQAQGFPTIGLTDTPYLGKLIPNVDVRTRQLDMHLLTGSFRGPTYNSYAFVVESFVDECAHAAGADPLHYRLDLLEGWPDPGWRRCLEVAAAKADWQRRPGRGHGKGIAVSNWGGFGRPQAGTTVATVADVEVARDGELRIRRIDVAFDCGRIANRDNVLHQLTGATIFGASVALGEEINIKDGAVVEGNFDAYQLLRMRDLPQVNVHLDALSGHERFGEIGEAGVGPVGAAIANAIFAATGKRLRTQPLRKHDLSW